MTAGRVHRAIGRVRREGPLGIARTLLSTWRPLDRHILYRRDIRQAESFSCELPIRIRCATAKEIADLCNRPGTGVTPRSRDYFTARVAGGDALAIALHGDTIAGYLAAMPHEMEWQPGRTLRLPPEKSYSYAGFVLRPYRGKRILAALSFFLFEWLRGFDKSYVFGTVSCRNVPSNKAMERMGYKPVGTLLQLQLAGRVFKWMSASNRAIVLGQGDTVRPEGP